MSSVKMRRNQITAYYWKCFLRNLVFDVCNNNDNLSVYMVSDRSVAVNDMGKINSRIISFVMILVLTGSLCFGITGCKKGIPKADIMELQTRDGLMLVINGTTEGPIDYYDDDRVTGIKYNVYWNGTIERTRICLSSGESEAGKAVLSSNDYMSLYMFCEDAYINDTYDGYQENDIMDGTTYGFLYYPADRDTGVYLYGGYCVHNRALSDAVSTVSSYFNYSVRATPTPVPSVSDLQVRSGSMLYISTSNSGDIRPGADGYCLVSYFINWNGEVCRSITLGKEKGEYEYVTLSEEDYMKLYEFAQDAYENKTYSDLEWEKDGDTYVSISYYPPEDDEFYIFSGYLYADNDFCPVTELLASYFE